MDKLFGGKVPNQVYMGQVNLGMEEMKEAIAAAKRLLGEGVFTKVKLNGDKVQCEQFGNDVVMVATVFSHFARAVENGTPVDNEVN